MSEAIVGLKVKHFKVALIFLGVSTDKAVSLWHSTDKCNAPVEL